MTHAPRTQLSLYVPPPMGPLLEAVRRVADPIQAALIPAHVTLARDAELLGVSPDLVRTRLRAAAPGALALEFGAAVRSDGHGLLLPCVAGVEAFHALRDTVLGGGAGRTAVPHLTLAHPRNPRADGNHVAVAHRLPQPLAVRFAMVHWIEQAPEQPWVIRESFVLEAPAPGGHDDVTSGPGHRRPDG